MGIRTIELDVGVTRDGAVVVHHDPALNPHTTRDRSGTWLRVPGPLLRELTLADLQEFDVGRLRPGSAVARRFPQQVPQDGAHIPTLDQVLTLGSDTAWNIEIKVMPTHPEWTVPAEEMVERVLHVAGAAGVLDRITIQSFDWRVPRHARRIRPSVARGWLTMAPMLKCVLWTGRSTASADDAPDAIAAEGGGTWTPMYKNLTKARLSRAHSLGLLVIPWTVNDMDDMRRLIGWGVDGLITDWPDRGLAAVAERPAEAGGS